MLGRDLSLIAVTITGIAGGVAAPHMAGIFSPYVLYFMMAILLLSFLRLDFAAIVTVKRSSLFEVVVWSFWKLIVTPVVFWALCQWIAPGYALAVLLLAGTSSGVTAPFFASLLYGNVERVLQVVVVTSLLVPLTLPSLAKILMGATLTISYWPMVRMLLLVIFVPLVASLLLRRLWPRLIPFLMRIQFSVLLSLFMVINLGVFSTYADFLRVHLEQVAWIVLVCFLGALASAGSGFFLGRISGGRLSGLDGAVLMTYINNILIVVFAARFFGPLEPLMAAAYSLPAVLMLVPIRYMER